MLSTNLRQFVFIVAVVMASSACKQSAGTASTAPVEIGTGSVCSLDGMPLGEFGGPKAQIHYRGVAEPELFCDTVEMFSIYMNPEQARRIDAMYVQDMGRAEWDEPRGHWIEARTAWYVSGSSRRGAMGRTLVPFSAEDAAKRFAGQYGGELYRFAEIRADMVNLDGGALHDQHM